MHHFSQDRAAERIAEFYDTSGATISRLESLIEPPKTRKRRQLAWALCVSYGVDPSDMGLTSSDRPPMAVVQSFFERAFDDLDEKANQEAPRIHDPVGSVQLGLFACAA